MQKNTGIIITIVALVVGIGIGYSVGANKPPVLVATDMSNQGMHMMPDGTMMSNGGETMSMADMMASMNAELAGKTGDEFDKAFITEMIVHHQGAVEMAELALTNARHEEIRTLAQAIITAQNKEIADMKAWLSAWYAE